MLLFDMTGEVPSINYKVLKRLLMPCSSSSLTSLCSTPPGACCPYCAAAACTRASGDKL